MQQGSGGQGDYLAILKMRELWFILPLIFVNYGIVGGIRGLWAGPYLELVHGIDPIGIGNIMLAIAMALVADPKFSGAAASGGGGDMSPAQKNSVVDL